MNCPICMSRSVERINIHFIYGIIYVYDDGYKEYLEADLSVKRAFSLTELLIVLVILAVLFAATMPIVTKRKMSTGDLSSESVWNYVSADINKTSYYAPGTTDRKSVV